MADKLEVHKWKIFKVITVENNVWKWKKYYLQGEFHGNVNKTFILKMQTVFKKQNVAEFMVAGLTK